MGEVTFNFAGKNFAVVGASSGIGKQVALELLQAGANVLAVARRKELMDEIYKDYPNQITTAKLDVTNYDGWNNILKSFVAEKGKFNGSVYCAGIVIDTALKVIEFEDLQKVMSINFFGAVMFMKNFIRAGITSAGSSNVWIASVAAHIGTRGLVCYEASKGAMVSAKRSIACEIANKQHRLNTVSPAWIETPMTENLNEAFNKPKIPSERYILRRFGKPEDISGMVLFLLSERATWITGADIIIDGGALGGGGYEL